MGQRLTQIATRTGDDGTTGLGDNTRVPKFSLRVQAMGDVDELNSNIGVLLCEPMPGAVRELLIDVQHQLFNLGGELSIPGYELLKTDAVLALDQALETHNASLPRLQEFILPAGTRAAVARARVPLRRAAGRTRGGPARQAGAAEGRAAPVPEPAVRSAVRAGPRAEPRAQRRPARRRRVLAQRTARARGARRGRRVGRAKRFRQREGTALAGCGAARTEPAFPPNSVEPTSMKPELKPLKEQVIVITGASSGIGMATALAAAHEGAKVVLAARSEATLQQIAEHIQSSGGTAIAVAADVADRAQVENVARRAVEQFGRIDTWVNDAGVSIYGRLDEVKDVDSRRLFDTNFWGVVNGSLTALPHLKKNQGGGALINVGSEVSDASIPLQGMYSASKHAVKGFTDALRVELDADEAAGLGHADPADRGEHAVPGARGQLSEPGAEAAHPDDRARKSRLRDSGRGHEPGARRQGRRDVEAEHDARESAAVAVRRDGEDADRPPAARRGAAARARRHLVRGRRMRPHAWAR